jgi:hypothetical protein
VSGLDQQWAWSQVEAMADGTLPASDEARMRAALRADARLREAVERATAIRGGLRRLGRSPVPPSLWRRLLRVPRAAARPKPRRAAGVVAAAGLGLAAAAIAAVAIFLEPVQTPPPAAADARAAAVADFAIAMTYLQRSATLANSEMGAAVRSGLRDALAVGRGATRNEQPEPSNGD